MQLIERNRKQNAIKNENLCEPLHARVEGDVVTEGLNLAETLASNHGSIDSDFECVRFLAEIHEGFVPVVIVGQWLKFTIYRIVDWAH